MELKGTAMPSEIKVPGQGAAQRIPSNQMNHRPVRVVWPRYYPRLDDRITRVCDRVDKLCEVKQ